MHEVYKKYAIEPSVIVQHDWKMLKSMYANVRSKYTVANANFKKSATHSYDFWNFCDSQLVPIYLHQFITDRPGIENRVTALPPCHLSLNSKDSDPFSNEPFTPTSSSGRRHNKRSEFTEIMNALEISGEVE